MLLTCLGRRLVASESARAAYDGVFALLSRLATAQETRDFALLARFEAGEVTADDFATLAASEYPSAELQHVFLSSVTRNLPAVRTMAAGLQSYLQTTRSGVLA
jgi:hypothetical protein